nr:hypothetical protein [Actinomycetales bacterium]
GASGTSFAIAALYLPVPLGFLAQTVGFATGNQDLVLRANFLVGVPTIWWYAPIATVLIGVGLWVLGLRRAGRGETAIGLAGAVFLAAAVAELFGIATGWNTQPTISGIVGLGLLLGVLLLATALVARTNPVPGLLLVLLSLVYYHRGIVAGPIEQVVTIVGLGVTLFGLVWTALTAGDFLHGDSRAFPRQSRVLLYLAGMLLGATAAAWLTLTRMRGGLFDVGTSADYGEGLLGLPIFGGVILVVGIAGLRALRRR